MSSRCSPRPLDFESNGSCTSCSCRILNSSRSQVGATRQFGLAAWPQQNQGAGAAGSDPRNQIGMLHNHLVFNRGAIRGSCSAPRHLSAAEHLSVGTAGSSGRGCTAPTRSAPPGDLQLPLRTGCMTCSCHGTQLHDVQQPWRTAATRNKKKRLNETKWLSLSRGIHFPSRGLQLPGRLQQPELFSGLHFPSRGSQLPGRSLSIQQMWTVLQQSGPNHLGSWFNQVGRDRRAGGAQVPGQVPAGEDPHLRHSKR